ncbi:hypothetical protein EDB83DRAFT_996296 [Lactarius deliciosus]|nr:hypothetical protein EDB83DRAFT_996296 [Lactarius deliciosus]
MTTTVSESQPSEDPGTTGSTPRRPIFQTETTGNFWSDVREAFKRLSPREDLQRIGEIPCARNSLLSGIASGVGVGVIRGLSVRTSCALPFLPHFPPHPPGFLLTRSGARTVGPFAASNWAMGTFMLVSLGTWTICQRNIQEERRRVQTIVEQLPTRVIAKPSEDTETP